MRRGREEENGWEKKLGEERGKRRLWVLNGFVWNSSRRYRPGLRIVWRNQLCHRLGRLQDRPQGLRRNINFHFFALMLWRILTRRLYQRSCLSWKLSKGSNRVSFIFAPEHLFLFINWSFCADRLCDGWCWRVVCRPKRLEAREWLLGLLPSWCLRPSRCR